VARLKHRGHEVGLREYFLEEAVYMRDTYGPKLPEAWDMYSRERWIASSAASGMGSTAMSFPTTTRCGSPPALPACATY
jgi:hypothetical protein